MSSELDPAKLKVVELRAELQARGLDVKGNKPVLVKRLKEALEAELQKEIPETSIADTSTEDLDATQEIKAAPAEAETKEPSPEPEAPAEEPAKPQKEEEPVAEPEPAVVAEEKAEPEPVVDTLEAPEQNGESANGEAEEVNEPQPADDKPQPAGDKPKPADDKPKPADDKPKPADDKPPEDTAQEEPMDEQPSDEQEKGEKIQTTDGEPRGDKRKHSSPSPERPAQRRRSKTPTQPEDEPPIDSSKVQLSWYDSDLHLQIDKETFLSGKPLHDGAFGYIWSGARLSHGIKSGKACYEVKVVENLKFEDILKIPAGDRKDRNRDKKDKTGRHEKDRNKGKDASADDQKKSESQTDDDKEMDDKEKDMDDKDMDDKEKDDKEKDEDAEEGEAPKEGADEDEEMKEESANAAEEEKKDEEEPAKMDVDAAEEGGAEKADEKEAEGRTQEEEHNIPPHLIRVGWSVLSSSLQLGEDVESYGLESTGKFFANKEISEHDIKFDVGDVVTAYLEIADNSVTMTFAVNGEVKTTVTEKVEDAGENFVLFPHVITRNYTFEINAGNLEEPWFPHPDGYSDYAFICNVEEKVEGPIRPLKRDDCEVVMMCGLPASGKTHWVKEYIEKTADKKYTIIGNSYILERMTVDAKPLEEKVNKGRWNVVLDKLTKCLNKLCEIASLRRRNYILDQTNVFPSAQRRKMRSFWSFKRHAVIVVNEDEEQTRRLKLQESQTGKDLPESAVLEMKANMRLPRTGDWLEKVTYVSLPETEAREQVQKYNTQGRQAGFGNMQHRRDYRDDRGYNNRWGGHSGQRRDYRGGNYRDNRHFQNNRFADRGHRQGGAGWRSGGGGGSWGMRTDRRDNRGPRDWRNNRGGVNDRHRGGANRDHRNHGGSGGGGGYNRNRNQGSGGGRNQGNWGNQMSGWNSQGQGNWGGQGAQGQNNWGGGQGWNQGQGSWNQNQWKYGGGYGQGGYSQYAPWNYYGQYAQNWNAQGQQGQTTTSTTATTSSNTTSDSSQQQYAQMTPQQQQAAWAQYAQQYAQTTATQNTAQK